ncbi:uncharacterized protein LOC115357890 [Myripristis murdjan]|uniref:uncharacterized protein LOC115357890 n=1 Tax=Myripristis murdjan TaxID=586833 RepID=UPI001176137F|nr:uncharacterized protein LOC115357890 [Myripristis murdjan]
MPAAVKNLMPVPPTGKDALLSTHIPFLYMNDSESFTTSSQECFRCFSPVRRRETVPQPIPAQLEHKDLEHIREYQTEMVRSYQRHKQPEITRIPRWTRLCTNFKMPTDHRDATFLTTHSHSFQSWPTLLPSIIRPAPAIKRMKTAEPFPESTQRASFTAHYISPVVKASIKHLEGFPTLKGDGRLHSFVSQYKDSFKGDWSRPPQPVEKQTTSSVAMGDLVKVVERETSHHASFSRPAVSRPAEVKERLKVNLGDLSNGPWMSSSMEAFQYKRPADPVVRIKRNQNFSSIPKGDTDQARNKEMTSATTNSFFFSEGNHTECPVLVSGADLMTKSCIEFSPRALTGLYYTTTAQEHYCKKKTERAKPAIQPPSHILTSQEPGPTLTTVQTDFLPLQPSMQRLSQSQLDKIKHSHIRFPLAHQHFNTTHSDDYMAKSVIPWRPSNRHPQLISHFVLQ